MRLQRLAVFMLLTFIAASSRGESPATQPAKLPFIQVDVASRQVRVECQAVRVDAPLEFFCVKVGGPEHETVLRTPARPSDIHLGLLMIGLEPGEPVRFSEATQKWQAPHGPPIRITVEFQRNGRTVTLPAARLMRSMKDQTPMPDRPFVFTGSRVMEDGQYAADVTGYVVSIVNFDLTPIDVPQVASNANETLEWQVDPDVAPAMGEKVTMVLQPVGDPDPAPDAGVERGHAPAAPTTRLSEVSVNAAEIDRLTRLWEQKVTPHDAALREAAQAQYEVIRDLRREQQRLIDEADRIQRLIDDLERKYQDMTTPRP